MSAPLLTRAELYRPGMLNDRDYSDLLLAEDTLGRLRLAARVEARSLADWGQDWPRWVTEVFEFECERRDRWATRRELRKMATEGGESR